MNPSISSTTKTSTIALAITQIACRYFVGSILFMYAYAKLLETQFFLNPSILDTPVRLLSGFNFVWGFYGYSYVYGVLLASAQIVGALFLFFRPTVRLGLLILLPVLGNIVMLDVFYNVQGAIGMALLLMAMCAFLFLSDLPSFKTYLQSAPSLSAPPISRLSHTLRWVKWVYVPIVVVGMFVLVHTLRGQVFALHELTGIWEFQDDSTWSRLYFNQGQICEFRPRVSERAVAGKCEIDQNQRRFVFSNEEGTAGQTIKFSGTYQLAGDKLILTTATRAITLKRVDAKREFRYVIP